MSRDDGLFDYLLRLGDSPLILAQRLGEWVGKGPIIEEDMALTNVGLDLLGQARLWLSYAGEVEARDTGEGRSEDQLAFLRDAGAFRNVLLVEQPNGSFAETIVRQFFFDAWHLPLLRALARLERSADRRDRRQERQGGGVPRRALRRLDHPAGRRHRPVAGADAGGGRRPVDVHRRAVPRGRDWSSSWQPRASPPTRARSRRRGARRSTRSSPKPRWRRRRASTCRGSGGPAARRECTPSTWAICWPRCSSCRARTRTRSGRRVPVRMTTPW